MNTSTDHVFVRARVPNEHRRNSFRMRLDGWVGCCLDKTRLDNTKEYPNARFEVFFYTRPPESVHYINEDNKLGGQVHVVLLPRNYLEPVTEDDLRNFILERELQK